MIHLCFLSHDRFKHLLQGICQSDSYSYNKKWVNRAWKKYLHLFPKYKIIIKTILVLCSNRLKRGNVKISWKSSEMCKGKKRHNKNDMKKENKTTNRDFHDCETQQLLFSWLMFQKAQENKKIHRQIREDEEATSGDDNLWLNTLYKYKSFDVSCQFKVWWSDRDLKHILWCHILLRGLLGALDVCTGVGAVVCPLLGRFKPPRLQCGVAVQLRGRLHPAAGHGAPYRIRMPSSVPSPVTSVLLVAARHTQHRPPPHGDERRGQDHVQTLSQLKLHAGGYVGSVEGLDHLVRGPRHRYERQEAGGEE